MTSSKKESLSKILAMFLVALFLFSSVAAAAGSREGTVDISVTTDDISVNPTHPNVGDVVKINVLIHNLGNLGSNVDVFIYDRTPVGEAWIGTPQVSVMGEGVDTVNWDWNTTGAASGFHEILVKAYPTDSTDADYADNNATFRLTLTNPKTAWIIDSPQPSFIGPKTVSDLFGIWSTGRIILENASIAFYQQYDFQYGIVMDDQGILTLRNTRIESNFAFRILMMGNSVLFIEPGSWVGGIITTRERAQVNAVNGTLNAGLDINGGNLTASECRLNGVFTFRNTNATFNSNTLTTNQTIYITGGKFKATDSEFTVAKTPEGALPDTFNASGGAQMTLTGVVSGAIKAQDTSYVLVYRYLSLHAEDTTGLAIPGATLWVRNTYGWEQAQCQTTDRKTGDARFTVITDYITIMGPKAIGSYSVNGMMGTTNAAANIQLAYYPDMTKESITVYRTIVFPPIFYMTGRAPDEITAARTVGDITKLNGDQTHAGDVYVRSTLTLNNKVLYIEQPSDFWAGVYVYPTGKIIANGGGIRSNHRMNVYIIGQGQIQIEPSALMGGVMDINSLVGIEDEARTKGTFTAKNCEFEGSILGQLEKATFTVSSISPHPYNSIDGALAFSTNLAEFNNATITSSSAGPDSIIDTGASLKFVNCNLTIPKLTVTGNSVIFSNCSLKGGTAGRAPVQVQSELDVNVTSLSILSCTLDYQLMFLNAQSFSSTSTTYPFPLVFRGSSNGMLTDVHAPAIIVNDSAEVTVSWFLTVEVIDSHDTPLEGAEITVMNYTTGSPIKGGVQGTGSNGKAQFILPGKKIYANDVVFLGNYKFKVKIVGADGNLSEAGPFEISMTNNIYRNVPLKFIPSIERFTVQIGMLSQYSGLSQDQTLYAHGTVNRTYRGGYTEPATGQSVTLSFNNNGTTYTAVCDAAGHFNISFQAPQASDRNITVTVTASLSGAETGSDAVYNFSVPLPKPDSLRISLINFDRTDRIYYKNRDAVTIMGNVEFMVKNKSIGVAPNVTVTVSLPILGRSWTGRTDASGGFRLLLGKIAPSQVYLVTVTATFADGKISIGSPAAISTFTVKNMPTVETKGVPILLVVLVIVIIVVIGAVGGFMYYRLQTEAAKLVECGECGAFIPENVPKCPRCDTEFETEVVKCSNCGSWIPSASIDCPKCLVNFKKKSGTPKPAGGAPKDGKEPRHEQPPAAPPSK